MFKPELSDFGIKDIDYISFSKYSGKLQRAIILTGGILGILFFLLMSLLDKNIKATNIKAVDYFGLFLSLFSSYVFGAILFGIIDIFVNDFFVRQHKVAKAVVAYETALLNYNRTQEEFWYSLNGFEFEKKIGQLFTSKGYEVKYTPLTNDGGIDLILNKNNLVVIVQCKAHKTPISPSAVRDLYGTLVSYKANSALLISTSGFTKGVIKFVQNKPIKLMTLKDIIELAES